MEAAIGAMFLQELSRLSSEQYETIDRKVGGGDRSEQTAGWTPTTELPES